MALTITSSLPAAGGIPGRGVGSNELGVNVRRFETRYFLEVDVRTKDNVGQTFERSVSSQFSREIRMEGEVLGGIQNIGTLAWYWFLVGFALTMFNAPPFSIPGYVTIQGAILVDNVVVTLDRSGWGSMVVQASSNPYLY